MDETVIKDLLTEQQFADQVHMALSEARRQRKAGNGPVFFRLSERRIRYRQADIDTWVADKSVAQ